MGIFNFKKNISQPALTPEEAEKKLIKLNKEIESNNEKIESQTQKIENYNEQISTLKKLLDSYRNDLEAEINIQSYGLYTPTYEFAKSDLYKDELHKVRELQKNMIKMNTAFISSISGWTVNGSVKDGNKMTADIKKLLLLAFNSQCDDIVAHITITNHQRSIEKIHKLRDSVSKLGSFMGLSISPHYVNLKVCEVNLALDFMQKKQEEKERLRELREQEREEKAVRKEIEEAKKKLEKEQKHYQNALEIIISQLKKDPDNTELLEKKKLLENDIAETNKAMQDVDYRQANIKAGYVYVISNIGAFGENIYKIGMTRRLEPMDRVDELGDASVPFKFDVHALIFTEDAPSLEAALHNAFEDKKVNKINSRREFFKVSLEEIKKVVRENFDKTVEWTDIAEADQYRQSLLLSSSERNDT